MGLVYAHVGVANIQTPDEKVWLECLVDSGATFSVIPRPILEQLGVKPYRRDRLSLANGEFIERDRGIANFSYETHAGTSDVIFGEPGDAELLGIVTLEQMGLILDPIRRELKTMPLILAGWQQKS